MATTRMTAADTHRHGCRTGTARIASGRAPAAPWWSVAVSVIAARSSGGGAVDREAVDLAGLDAPGLQDLLVGAVGLELLEGGLDGLVEALVVGRLGDGDPV